MLLNPDTRPFKFSCVILIFQACTWFICAIYRLLRAAHSPEYTHEHSVKFVLVFGVLGLWYLINIILIVRTREALRDTTWVIQLLGLPPAFLSFAAIISVSFATMSYADNDEVTFQSLFEVASGLTLVSIASYCYTYINNGLQFLWMKRWLVVNGICLAIYALFIHLLNLEIDKYFSYSSLAFYIVGFATHRTVHIHHE
eukprot:TRINITY_DN4130_c0_g1_i2.p1 TRINITY_DN4130_c0_g1~~TRINITY_DN4130_c0_g1_i2.p1  ORF type:complete len:199 (-),score=11.49 TRINITY_DN4130_c0_g1_i2:287-883(-)